MTDSAPPLFESIPSLTNDLTLDEVTARLARHTAVSGIMWVGSTGTGDLTPYSDYDVILFLHEMPVPLHVVFTTVGGVLTDFILSTPEVLTRIATATDISELSRRDGSVMHWVQNGRICHDPAGMLVLVQSRLRSESWQATVPYHVQRDAWQKINYNWLQTKRMLAADDPVYETAVDMRLLYMLSELYVAYFQVRNLAWQGEKAAVRAWQANDPEYLALMRRCLAEPERRSRFALYEALARRTLAPVGGLWLQPATSFAFDGIEPEIGDWETAVGFWGSLVSE